MTQDEQYDEFYKEFAEETRKYDLEQRKLKNAYKKQLKGLTNVTGIYRFLNDNDSWQPLGIFTIQEIPDTNKVRITDNNPINTQDSESGITYDFVKNTDNYRGETHYYVWQRTSGMEGDSFYGYLLIPLKNGKYFKVSYQC